MAGVDENAEASVIKEDEKDDDEVSEAGSEDLEAESSGEEDEDDLDEEEVEGEGEGEVEGEEMDLEKPASEAPTGPVLPAEPTPERQQHQAQDVMVH